MASCGFVDSDCVGVVNGKRFTNEYVFSIFGNVIS